MKRLRRLVVICAAAAALSLGVSATAQGSPTTQPDRQVLVMVRHPPDHFRPSGSYGGGSGYGDDLARSARERLARGIAHDHGLKFVDGWPMPMIGVDCFIMAVPDGRSTSAAAEELSHDSKVAWAEPVEMYQAQSAPASHNDPLYRAQPAARDWDLADLHRVATGRGIKVAVIDSGIQANHPDLAGQLIVNRNFVVGQSEVAEDHGTGVAGVIAAKTDNKIGIAGVAPGARLLGLRACWQQGAATLCDGLSLAKAIYFAAEEKADVINLSLSGPDGRLLRTLLEAAIERGSVVVTAYDASKPGGGFPASVPGVIAVSDRSLAPSSAHVYTAPGHDVPTTQPGGRWFLVNGSSFSAAHVSGLAALVRERQRSAGMTLVSDRAVGGTIDACATLARAAKSCDCSCGGGRFASARFAH
ncbi:MAG TPA: S8 family serine peptidase [Sphingomicrobium sp.]|jgi:subtilisin family serine protease|nr:S8 family serine peptidase [Sphingomicrobium sp.]